LFCFREKELALARWATKKNEEAVAGYDDTLNIPFGNMKI
jgi:hypothetical protein